MQKNVHKFVLFWVYLSSIMAHGLWVICTRTT